MTNALFKLPSAGGWLTIVNGAFWVIFFYVTSTRSYSPANAFEGALMIATVITFSLPLAIACLLPTHGPDTIQGTVAGAIVFGLNAFLWGYGLAAIGRATSRVMRAMTMK